MMTDKENLQRFKNITPDILDTLCETLPCRIPQVINLLQLFGQREQQAVQSIFVFGDTSTGKTMVVKSVLQTLLLPHAFVNCVECYTPAFLFQTILNQVAKEIPGPENNYTNYVNCDNMNDFVNHFKSIVHDRKLHSQTFYIVIDRAERLRNLSPHILAAFLRIQELTKLNVCTILISEIVWEKFRGGTGLYEPMIVYFPAYSKDQLLEILSKDYPSEVSQEFYRNYVGLVLDVFLQVCRNLTELKLMVTINFSKYCEPLNDGDNVGVKVLWRNIEPVLKTALNTVYMREISTSKWETIMQELRPETPKIQTKPSELNSFIELPYYSKFLLIAAYLASYNPAKSDKRFFVKHHGRISKHTRRMKNSKEKISNQLLGPKAFPLDRLLAIFYAIVEEPVQASAVLLSQIASLVALGLLTRIGNDSNIDLPKYKCLASFNLINSIGRTVKFEVVNYLYDFL